MKTCYCKRESPNGSSKNERQILDTSDIFQLLYFLKDTCIAIHSKLTLKIWPENCLRLNLLIFMPYFTSSLLLHFLCKQESCKDLSFNILKYGLIRKWKELLMSSLSTIALSVHFNTWFGSITKHLANRPVLISELRNPFNYHLVFSCNIYVTHWQPPTTVSSLGYCFSLCRLITTPTFLLCYSFWDSVINYFLL